MTKLSELKAQRDKLLAAEMTTEQKIANLEKQLADLRAELAAPKEWKPEAGEEYWTLHNAWCVDNYTWMDSTKDNALYARGLVFRTKEDAEAWDADRVEYYAVIRELRKIAAGFVPDYEDISQEKRVLVYNHKDKSWMMASAWRHEYTPWPAFKPGEQEDRVLALGDRLNVLLRWPR